MLALLDALDVARGEFADLRDLDNLAGVEFVRVGVHRDFDPLPASQPAQHRFRNVNPDPLVFDPQDTQDRLVGRHDIAFAHGEDFDANLGRRTHDRLGEIGFQLVQLAPCFRSAGVGGADVLIAVAGGEHVEIGPGPREVGSRLVFLFLARAGQIEIEPGLGGLPACPGPVEIGAGDIVIGLPAGIRLREVLFAFEFFLGQLEIGFRGAQIVTSLADFLGTETVLRLLPQLKGGQGRPPGGV